MNCHKVPKANIHEDLKSIEREGEHVHHITMDAQFFYVFTDNAGITTRDAVYNNVAGGGRV